MTIQFEHDSLLLRTLASGAQLRVPVFRFTGGAGKNVYIQANIHGPEIAGIGAAHRLIDLLRAEPALHGSITIVPSINPVGLDAKINGMQVGYADLNETVVGNFNRVYQLLVTEKTPTDAEDIQRVGLEDFAAAHKNDDVPTITREFHGALKRALADVRAKKGREGLRFGVKLALTVQELCADADYLIDLHTAGIAQYHIFAFDEVLPSVPYFGIAPIIVLPDDFAGVLDEAFLLPWVRLRKALQKVGRDLPFSAFEREAFTLELGSADKIDARRMDEDARRILNYLRHKGVLEGAATPYTARYYKAQQSNYARYNAPTGGLILWHKRPGDHVKTGEALCTILCAYNRATALPTEVPVLAVADGVVNNLVESQVVHEGMALCSVMTRIEDVTF
ncbi:MAG: succinylglutamate desuccinylase/aspartoacylase family protein [Chloroflexi bacterium]|nr:succinylglutamate desuccinylase/aspartoacylase family protein [Chloroflexota bacterium]